MTSHAVTPPGIRAAVFRRDDGLCAGCGAQNPWLGGDWQADHIIPLVDGGDITLANLQTLCIACHAQKTKHEAGERAARRREARRDQSSELPIGETA